MSMLKSIGEWIEDRGIGFTIGTNLYVGHLPLKRVDGTEPPDRCTTLLENAGGSVYFDLTDRVDKMLQVLSRAIDYTDAETDALTIYDELHGNAGLRLPTPDVSSGTLYVAMTIQAVSAPAPIGQDDKDRWRFSTNYIVRIRDFKT